MHELAVCQSLIGQVDALALARRVKRVVKIVVQVGPLSGVEGELLQRAFSIAKLGTCAEDAEMILEGVPVRVRCVRCHEISMVKPQDLRCRHCEHWQTHLESGDELILRQVEMEDYHV